MQVHRSPRILISRLSHIGDCILTVPLLEALRQHFPEAFIAWIVESPTNQLLNGHPALNQLITLRRGWMKSPSCLRKLRRQLQGLKFDIAVDPQSLTKSSLLAWLSGAGCRLGLPSPWGRELAPWLNTRLVKPTKPHVVDRSLELLQPLGIYKPKVRFRLPKSAQADQSINRFISQSHLGCDFAVVNPGAGWKSRQWSSSRFGAVAKYLGQRLHLPSVVTWAGDEERGWAETIVSRSGGHALLAPTTNLLELGQLLRSATMYVGCDTGPMHLAVAVGTSCVVLHGTTLPEISGPYGPQHETVQAYYQRGTSRQRRRAGNDAMLAIDVDDVCAACDRLIQRRSIESTRKTA